MSTPETTERLETANRDSGTFLLAGTRVDRLVIVDHVGEGGMGHVYAAYDKELDRRVCLKFPKSAGPSAVQSADHPLRTEGRILARISHPNVLPLHDVGVFEGRLYLVMEYVQGWNLREWQAEAKPTSQQILAVYLQAGQGLAAAHSHGIVHRDFKPDNVMVGGDGRVRVMDFGLASSVHDTAQQEFGTLRYMAPELRQRATASAASDQYAFAVALTEALQPAPPGIDWRPEDARVDLSTRQQQALRRALAPDPAQRFASMTLLLSALAPERAPPVAAYGVGATLILAATGAVWQGLRDRETPCEDSANLIASSWSGRHAESLRSRFAESPTELARQVGTRAIDVLSNQAIAWVTVRNAACRATRVDLSQSESMLDRQMMCLDRRRREIDAVFEALTVGDQPKLSEVEDILQALEPVDACANLAILGGDRQPPPGAAQRPEFERIDGELTRLNVLMEAGKFDGLIQRAETALAAAQRLGHAGLIGRAHFVHGLVLEPADQLQESAAAFEASFRSAVALNDPDLLGDALGRLLFLASSRDVDSGRLRQWIEWKQALASIFAADPYRLALLDQEHGMALEPGGDYVGAEALLRRARDNIVAKRGRVSPASLRVRGNHAAVLVWMGRHAQARNDLESIISDYTFSAGEQHPALATLFGNLAVSQGALGESAAALSSIERALDIAIVNFGPVNSEVGRLKINFAVALNEAKDFARAEHEARSADEIIASQLGPKHPWRLPAHSLAAKAAAGQGRVEDALRHLDQIPSHGVDPAQLPPLIQLEWHLQIADYAQQLQQLARVDAELSLARALLGSIGDDPQVAPFQAELDRIRSARK